MNLNELLEFDRLARINVEKYPKNRFIFNDIYKLKGKHFIGIAGPRGVGKTVIIKQLAVKVSNSIYISLDTFKGDLFEVVKELNEKLKIKYFFFDEIHFYQHYDAALKKIYDFLNVKVIFTSSVSISLFKSSYDLSRRVIIKELYPFSFREYLYFKNNTDFSHISINDIINKKWDNKIFSYSKQFDEYLKGGNFPFALDEPFIIPILKNIVSTVVRKDIPAIERIMVDEIETIENLITFIGKSGVDGINYSSLSKNINITKYKAKQYVMLLEKTFILLRVMPEGSNVMKEPKILMALPFRLIYKEYNDAIGALREDYFVETMLSIGKKNNYLKSTRGKKTLDYIIRDNNQKIVIELGGKGKGRRQFKDVSEEKKIIFSHSIETEDIKRPLFMSGFLEGGTP